MADSPTLGGRYQIEQPPIGQGGMGVVYRAFDKVTKRPVALKTVRGPVDPSGIELFQREWTVLARLCHPNIIDILDIGEFSEDGIQKPYFVMPLLPGMTLDKLIKNARQRLTPERVVEIVCQACRGLQAAHDQKLVHRDIKPSNLFVMNDDSVKIIDFGVVHLADVGTSTAVKGTPPYMAPEQFENKPATAKSDIFSLGVVCYEALTGRKPFERERLQEVSEAICNYIPPPITDLNPAVSDQFSRAVHRAMAKAPYHRFSSAKEFSDVLQRAVRGEQIEILSPARIQPRILRVKRALTEGDHQFALEVLGELESEGNIDPEISVLRLRAQQGVRDKSIRQLIESARTRFEEEEYPLALQKIQDVLALDPRNVDAAALKAEIEKKRSAAQIDRWFEIAQQHLQNKSFHKAQEAAEEVLKIDRNHAAAQKMLAEIGRAQEESSKLHQERHRLYESALKAYQNGEISSALGKLERVIQLGKLSPGHPTTDAQYLAFYDQVRSERDELRERYTEARKLVEAQDFEKALAVCRNILSQRPAEALFLSLKIEIEERRRQDSSAKIARLHSHAEAEPDLERKYAILQDAVQQFPDEQVFRRSLASVKERRDLVNSIVVRARQYESQGQFADAVNQWEVLRNIYSQYPALEFELERLGRKQQEQIREEQKAGWIGRIDQALDSNNYAEARSMVEAALSESPDDPELLRLREQISQNFERAQRASILVQEGRSLAAQGKYSDAIERLRAANNTEAHNQYIRYQLGATLVQQAKVLARQDPEAAAPVLREALALAPGEPSASSVSALIEDVRRSKSIERYLSEAHELQRKGGLAEAAAKVATALREYPGEPQLLRLQNTLRLAISDATPTRYATAAVAGSTPAFGATDFFEAPSYRDFPSGSESPRIRRDVASAQEFPERTEASAWLRNLRSRKFVIGLGAVAAIVVVLAVILLLRPRRPEAASPHVETTAQVSGAQGPASQPQPQSPPSSEASPATPSVAPPSAERPAPVKTVRFQFDSDPSSAQIVVDGNPELSCSTPCEVPLPVGRHGITAQAEGHSPQRRVVQVPSEKNAFFLFGDERKTVRLTSVPAGMQLTVDGVVRGETPLSVNLSPGSHKIQAVKGSLSYSQTIKVAAEEDLQYFKIQPAGADAQQDASP